MATLAARSGNERAFVGSGIDVADSVDEAARRAGTACDDRANAVALHACGCALVSMRPPVTASLRRW